MHHYYTIIFLLFFATACQTKSNADDQEINNPSSLPKSHIKISKLEAIDLAKQFVRFQGYTKLSTPITADQVQFEEEEFASDPMSLVKNRKGSLSSNAFGARSYGANNWAVAFEMHPPENNIGKAVTMDSTGHDMKISKTKVRLDWIKEPSHYR